MPGLKVMSRGLALAAGALLATSCTSSTVEPIAAADLLGSWSIVATGVILTFEAGSTGQQYQLRDPQGAYSHLLNPGSDILAEGGWFTSRSTLIFLDDGGPVACAATSDRFVVTMNSAKTIMTLTHVGDECVQRSLILADYGWQRLAESD